MSRGELLARLRAVSIPTLGHFLEDGFLAPEIRRLAGSGTLAGVARTVRISEQDATAMNRAILRVEPGEVLVVSMSGDIRHAPLGAVTAAALFARGAAGVVVDGAVTDLGDLRASGLSVYARGTSCLTTKRRFGDESELGVPVECGGVLIRDGDLVLGDDNGVVALTAEAASAVVGLAEASDAAEPALLARIRAGEPLANLLALGPRATSPSQPDG
ncbi:RraA family protein [Sinomonas sp. JGH33]|uniref:Putative 4-hydroxy-4-methyl-2-oxoglutarate aldolase n=1 Tax=Sinomonas terricola TaxID=3110330 RepID=A0ABU5T7V2_9MICC|nr:RraA family protein [Sinomonas sp. JGH33]MEA5455764.1 RraA family protein [Sinomonas sp. JGH33]